MSAAVSAQRAPGAEMAAGPTAAVEVANAPVSYGAFEITLGTSVSVPEPGRVLAAIAQAGYAGTELGPPGYLGEGEVLRERLQECQLALVGGFVPVRFSERPHWEEDLEGLRRTLDLFDAAASSTARPVLCDGGGPERRARPGASREDPALRLGRRRWQTLVSGVHRAAEAARERGYEPVFHHHASTYVEGVAEIERLLQDTDVALLLDTGHLAVAGGDPVAALRDWGERISAIHIKDVRLRVLRAVKEERADMLTAWRRGLFCPLGEGEVDLHGFCAELNARSYRGWVAVEQDRVLESERAFEQARREQQRNRQWLREHAGW